MATPAIGLTRLLILLVLGMLQHLSCVSSVTISVNIPAPSSPGDINTLIGTGQQIMHSEVGSTSMAIVWGIVSTSDMLALCADQTQTGSYSFGASVNVGTQNYNMQLQISSFGGCGNPPFDISGVEIGVSNYFQRNALANTETSGCAFYMTGVDVDNISEGTSSSSFPPGLPYPIKGDLVTTFDGVTHKCTDLGPQLQYFCTEDMEGVSAGLA